MNQRSQKAVITINESECTGCGVCIDICPTGALYMIDGKAVVDRALCRVCDLCSEACPSGAITLTAHEEPVAEAVHVPALRPEAEVIKVREFPAPVPFGARVLPVVGGVMAWAGREILLRLVDLVVDRLAPLSQAQPGTSARDALPAGTRGSSRRQRHRRRWQGGGSDSPMANSQNRLGLDS